ncbi:FtsK/SpoIIIE domain-containing protein [Mycobacteroides abscessus]|uniref:FtsK/SpoIIIE domain-containing protein n=1 Tax=Mycobacteroides abscessus TaxID=36809 RepID=UPI000927B18C|nr:FtsK/SpoIIIE domain-containing protein [Mycobacteroides abscessus]SIF25794.1 ftsk/SpoIIIE family protein, putative [Mycobacteroides abscessus subsp. abscessus]SIF38942.1 ftsk/SpoIIIE family protein, putative [Mycobacteroides abscessus subsp. abscessus]SIF83391.1 ftsk/SpoIIIE family protein, putative [Mycobacteroides abscessus subsp. abscessus]
MADIDALLGVRLRTGKAARGETTPDPQPKRGRKATPEPQHEEPTAPTGPTAEEARAAKAAQTAAITAAVDELAALWAEIDAGATCPGPQQVKAVDDEETSPEHVARLWTQRFESEEWRRHMFGCNAPALARAQGTGVAIKAEIRPDMDPTVAIQHFQQAALAMGAGGYDGAPLPGRGPRGGQLITLWRTVVGVDPATEWNAAGHAASGFYTDRDFARRRILYTAGLGVYKPRRAVPTVLSVDAGERGPEIRLRLLSGQDPEALAASCEGKLRNIFRCPDLTARVDGVDLVIALNHRPPAAFPDRTPLSPQQLWRPRNKAESLIAARDGVLIPFGVDRSGKPLMLDMRKRPHFLITGTSGAGKSTVLRLILRALQMQLGRGGVILLGDGKQADMVTVYEAGVGQNLSVENASIHRAIAYVHDELERRKKMYKQLVGRKLPQNFPLLILCIDELGAWAGRGLAKGSSKADAAGVEAAMAKLRYILRQGRSYGVHIIISTQDVTVESGINTALLSVVSTRVVVGRPEEGSGSAMDKLFTNAERPRVAAAAKEIPPGAQGIGVMVDEAGIPTVFKAFYNDGEAARVFDAATAAAGRARRFAWKFPDDDGAWMLRTCAEFGDLEPVDSIPTIALEDEQGRYIESHARYDEGNALAHDPGTPPDNSAHATY